MDCNIQLWQEKNLKNFLSKTDIINLDGIEHKLDSNAIQHIIDWLNSDDSFRHIKRILRMSVPDAYKLSLKWTEKLNKNFIKNNDFDGIESVLALKNGFSIVKLKSSFSYEREGAEMGHCARTYYDRKDCELFSLRDKNNDPHCTIEFTDGEIRQIKGKGNSEVSPKYHPYIIEFLNNFDYTGIHRGDLSNINCNQFGTFIWNKEDPAPKELIINKKIKVSSQKIETPFNKIEINGDFILNHVWGQQILADEIIVNGDLLIDGVRGMLRLCNKLKVMGDVEIVGSNQLKILSKECEIIGNVYIEDCAQFIQKIECDGELEFSDCPKLK